MIRVSAVDDRLATIRGLDDLLKNEAGIQLVGSAESGEEALGMIAALQPDVVVLDYRLPDMAGAEVVAEIRRRGESARVLAFSAYSEPAIVQAMLDAGALGDLLKSEELGVTTKAINRHLGRILERLGAPTGSKTCLRSFKTVGEGRLYFSVGAVSTAQQG